MIFKIYQESLLLVGGLAGSPVDSDLLSSVELYTAQQGETQEEWSKEFPPLPEARCCAVGGALDDFIIICGGYEEVKPVFKVSNKCWALVGCRRKNKGINRWMVLSPLPVPVAMAAAVVVEAVDESELWVFGGLDEKSEATDKIQIYNPQKGWRIEPDGVGIPLAHHSAIVHGEWVYIVNGEKCYRYSISERKLENLPDTGEPFDQAGSGVATIEGGEAWVVVREDAVKWIGLPYMKGEAGERDEWNALYNMPVDKAKNPSIAQLGEHLYVAGGADSGDNAQETVFRLKGDGQPWDTGARTLKIKRHSHVTILMKAGW